MKYLLIISIAFLTSCSANWRLQRLLDKHPELVKTDTIFEADTITVIGSTTDTIFKNSVTKDTIIIRENNLIIKYYNSGDSIFIQGAVRDTTIIREVPVYINTVEKEVLTGWQKTWSKIKDFLIVLLLGGIIVLLYLQIKKLKKLKP